MEDHRNLKIKQQLLEHEKISYASDRIDLPEGGIDCGEGWRHFDTTPRLDKSFKGFYLTDQELMAYSDAHYHSHNYDREIYTYFNDGQEAEE